jgi:uncharacterized Tic20 family protein
MNDQHTGGERPEEPDDAGRTGEERDEPTPQDPPEVEAEPFDAARDRGPTIDAPGTGDRAKAADRSKLLPILCHLAPLVQIVFYLPGVNVLAPLLLWQLKKDDPEVDDHGSESVNFQINVLGLSLILMLSCVGAVLLPVLWVAAIVMVVVAAVQASEGKRYRYPFTFRVLRRS